jgi:hypothetical protein
MNKAEVNRPACLDTDIGGGGPSGYRRQLLTGQIRIGIVTK